MRVDEDFLILKVQDDSKSNSLPIDIKKLHGKRKEPKIATTGLQ